MRVKKVGKYTVSVFNPVGYNCLNPNTEHWGSPKRTPFLLALSNDDGRSFSTRGKTPALSVMREFAKCLYYIEDDYKDSYCYPAIIETKDGFLISYYHSNGTPVCLNSMKIVKVRYDEL